MALPSSSIGPNEVKQAPGGRRDLDIEALREENERLRKLVTQLSELIIRNVAALR